jgi:hypothetical protein
MLGRVAGQVFDAMIHPQVRKFCLSSALRMNEADLLRGGAAAAHAVLSASAAKRLHGDPDPLAELATSGSLHPYLHSMLANTGQHGDSVALEAQHRRHLGATATLEHARLIVGARRSTYVSSDRTVRNYRCTLGSHLVVVADRPHGTPGLPHRGIIKASSTASCPANTSPLLAATAFMCPRLAPLCMPAVYDRRMSVPQTFGRARSTGSCWRPRAAPCSASSASSLTTWPVHHSSSSSRLRCASVGKIVPSTAAAARSAIQ